MKDTKDYELSSEHSEVRLNAYRKYGFTSEAFKDETSDIRLEAYRKLGFTEESKKDKNANIRYKAYESLGYTEEALRDTDCYIREKALRALDYRRIIQRIAVLVRWPVIVTIGVSIMAVIVIQILSILK